MDETVQHLGTREDGFNRFEEAFEAINAGDQNILYTAIFQVG